MATITLSADTLISTLMPSGGGSLASGDTIQLAGHSLIIDADAVDYPVTIANSGADANLELRDLGRIKLNATLPANVHPYIDPAHPLPVAAEPGIDGDPYRTNLTSNARAEIQLNGNFSLGGGAARLPTATRDGKLFSQVVSVSGDTVYLSQDMDLHPGDSVADVTPYNYILLDVVSYDKTTRAATLSSASGVSSGDMLVSRSVGVAIVYVSSRPTSVYPTLTSPLSGGSAGILSQLSGSSPYIATSSSVFVDRFVSMGTNSADSGSGTIGNVIGCANVVARQAFGGLLSSRKTNASANVVASCRCDFGEWCGTDGRGLGATKYAANSSIRIRSGKIVANLFPSDAVSSAFVLENCAVTGTMSPKEPNTSIRFVDCDVAGNQIDDTTVLLSGTISGSLHAPATSSDVTWRYTDRTVAPGATLRLRCAWKREGGTATRSSVAVTDPATWWPQLWPLGVEALASVEFTGGTADWRSELLSWRNTGTEAATVRVWECVTGTTGGGYLKVEEVKGGAL